MKPVRTLIVQSADDSLSLKQQLSRRSNKNLSLTSFDRSWEGPTARKRKLTTYSRLLIGHRLPNHLTDTTMIDASLIGQVRQCRLGKRLSEQTQRAWKYFTICGDVRNAVTGASPDKFQILYDFNTLSVHLEYSSYLSDKVEQLEEGRGREICNFEENPTRLLFLRCRGSTEVGKTKTSQVITTPPHRGHQLHLVSSVYRLIPLTDWLPIQADSLDILCFR